MKDCENVILIWGTKLWVHRQFNLDNENMTAFLIRKEKVKIIIQKYTFALLKLFEI